MIECTQTLFLFLWDRETICIRSSAQNKNYQNTDARIYERKKYYFPRICKKNSKNKPKLLVGGLTK